MKINLGEEIKPKKLFCDSGAFSIWNSGLKLNLDDYIRFLKVNKHLFVAYSVFDDMQDPEKTLENQRKMEAKGLSPIPCFHVGEPEKYLCFYLKNYPYISIGGMVGKRKGYLIKLLDYYFSKYICNAKGEATTKVHGFGIASFSLLFRFPWYSADSTSAVRLAALGKIIVPKLRGGEFRFDLPPSIVECSGRYKDYKSNKFIFLSQSAKEKIARYLEIFNISFGKSEFFDAPSNYELKENEVKIKIFKDHILIERIIERGILTWHSYRNLINLYYFAKVEEFLTKNPPVFKHRSLHLF